MKKNYAPCQVESVDVTLTVEELMFLQIIMAKIGGGPTNSLRKYQTSISKKIGNSALLALPGYNNISKLMDEGNHSIYFNDDSHLDAGFIQAVEDFKKG